MSRRFRSIALAAVLSVALALVAAAGGTVVDINPDVSGNADANASTGGRINAGLANVEGQPNTYYAASEYGGLFKTTDGGATWAHLDGHLPTFGWDVEVDPTNANKVYATSWYDGRVASLAGIEVSSDAGATWSKPATSTPPAAYTCSNTRKTEPSAFGIGIRPDAANNVFVGTNCGVAISTDSGATWTFSDPTPATTATNVWDVVVQGGGPSGQGIVDVCGDDGHFRSTDGGASWTAGGAIPLGRCSIAASPDESYVLFVVAADNNVYESDDAGATWTNLGQQAAQGRIPFVTTNQRSDDGDQDRFDVWYSDTQLFSDTCETPDPPAPGGANRCGAVATWTNQQTGAHWDAGDLVFDPGPAADACPRIYTTDGGAHVNALDANCQTASWTRSNVGLHALWVWSMDGQNRAGAGEDLYFGTQDNGTFATTTAAAGSPTWTNPNCCDTFDMVATASRVLGSVCCFSGGRFNRLELANPGYAGNAEINTYPAGNVPGFTWGKRVNTWGGENVVLITSAGVFTTADITASPIVWTQLPALPVGGACNVQVAVSGGTPTFFVQTGQCTGRGSDNLYSHTGTGGAGSWTRIDNTDGITGGIGVFAVDPADPNRLYASNTNSGNPHMIFSTDGGTNWTTDAELDTLMTGNGTWKFFNASGPVTFNGGAGASFSGYYQPTLLAYSEVNGDVIVAGGTDAGVFVSTDGGANWGLVTDPFTATAKPHIPRPRYAYFDDEPGGGTISLYVGSQGRGVWRLSLETPTADAGGPYNTVEGTDVALNGGGSTGTGLSYAWDLDNDGQYDDSTLVNPLFTLVGQDGSFTVGLKVTNADGLVDTDTATVDVANVAPAVENLASDGPRPENTAVTLTGTIRDPGWLEALTATVDWDDGAGPQALPGILENVRPDATLTFSVQHTYGDNGTYDVRVCGIDDDTSTCAVLPVSISNVDPTSAIDETGTVLINGVPTFIAQAGDTVTFSGRSTDPGSDDLFLSWDWDDGAPSPDVTTTYLVNPPSSDPAKSPTIQPRDVTDSKSHVFDACLFDVGFLARDDDNGTSADTVAVIVTGTSDRRRSAGYWQNVYDPKARGFTTETLLCYLEIAGFVSTVFHVPVDASTIAAAASVLKPGGGTTTEEQFDRQLLAALLNFANGSVGWTQLVDTDADGTPDTPFNAVIANAEAIRLNPASTDAQIEAQKNLLERINLNLA